MARENNVQQYLMVKGCFPDEERWECWSTPDEIQSIAEEYNSHICGVRSEETDEWEWYFNQKTI